MQSVKILRGNPRINTYVVLREVLHVQEIRQEAQSCREAQILLGLQIRVRGLRHLQRVQ